MFPTDAQAFPVKNKFVFVSSCSVSPLHQKTNQAVQDYSEAQMMNGISLFREIPDTMSRVNRAAAKLLQTELENISFVRSTAEGLSLIANGYPFAPGDEILTYSHEYPANHYPWRIQEIRGAKVELIPDMNLSGIDFSGRPCGFSLEQLESKITPRTRIVAVSHVQFTSGFAVDLQALGDLCFRRGIDLVIDAAQSLGSLPVHPEKFRIAAVASSGWKWLLGPIGTGILFTSPEFRKKLRPTMGGPEMMRQGNDYLNLSWNPHPSGRMFEYSTPALGLAEGLSASLEELFVPNPIEQIRDRIFALKELFVANLDRTGATPLIFPPQHQSGIQSIITKRDPAQLCEELYQDGFIFSNRGGYLRMAPHCYLTDDEIIRAAAALNRRMKG